MQLFLSVELPCNEKQQHQERQFPAYLIDRVQQHESLRTHSDAQTTPLSPPPRDPQDTRMKHVQAALREATIDKGLIPTCPEASAFSITADTAAMSESRTVCTPG